jgi:hypothetical protein
VSLLADEDVLTNQKSVIASSEVGLSCSSGAKSGEEVGHRVPERLHPSEELGYMLGPLLFGQRVSCTKGHVKLEDWVEPVVQEERTEGRRRNRRVVDLDLHQRQQGDPI